MGVGRDVFERSGTCTDDAADFAQSCGGCSQPRYADGVDPETQESRPADTPLGVDPSTQNSTDGSDSADDAGAVPTAPVTSDDMATRQNPIGVPHQVHSGPFGTTTEDPNAE